MKIILLNDVRGLGKKFDIKTVSDGYAMNFLLPNKLAEQAKTENIKRVEELKQEKSAEIRIQEDLLEKNLKMLKKVRLEMFEKASEKGGLFKGVNEEMLSKELKKQVHIEIPAQFIVLEKPIKEIGEHTVLVKVGDDTSSFALAISPER